MHWVSTEDLYFLATQGVHELVHVLRASDESMVQSLPHLLVALGSISLVSFSRGTPHRSEVGRGSRSFRLALCFLRRRD